MADDDRPPWMLVATLIVAGLACEFLASWLAVDLRHAAKVTLAITSGSCVVALTIVFAAWVSGDIE